VKKKKKKRKRKQKNFSTKKKTKFEKEQDELIQEMDQLENQNLEIKKWQMSGEVSSWTRPQNSLLEEDVDFRHTSKVKPIITEEITQNLEEIT
jgi:U3 small nucleolar RNA-associated protein MPP10